MVEQNKEHLIAELEKRNIEYKEIEHILKFEHGGQCVEVDTTKLGIGYEEGWQTVEDVLDNCGLC